MVNIAVDGPSGAGKSYLARAIAKRCGYIYVDTGALYRAVALSMIERNIDIHDSEAVINGLSDISISLEYNSEGEQVVLLCGRDVGGLIRTPEVSMGASVVSAIPRVREYLLDIQKNMAKTHDVVMDGRDIGTVILPDSQVKIFLCASDKARARRRFAELTEEGIKTTLEEVEADMSRRDNNDRTREVAPAVAAPDAVILDNSDLDREQTVDAALRIVADKLK